MKISLLMILIVVGFVSCNIKKATTAVDKIKDNRIPVIIDTDANNELDDQHALAYLFYNGDVFNTIGVTVNVTYSGGGIADQIAEAERVMKLCNVEGVIPLLAGASGDYEEIVSTVDQEQFDGSDAVKFIIKEARKPRSQKLVLIPVGKLTNIALALFIAPDIKDKVKIVWLGANYPDPGEYNLENDIPSMNYVLDQNVPFEMVMVRYGLLSGSDAVRTTGVEMEINMPDAGLKSEPVIGRHGGSFTCFGDYSIDLFRHVDLYGNPPSRALFDMVAVAVLKNPAWGEKYEIPSPIMINEKWVERPEMQHKVVIWENFNSQEIVKDFFETINNPTL